MVTLFEATSNLISSAMPAVHTKARNTLTKHSDIFPAETTVTSVVILGLGYVGLPLAILAEQQGLRVSGFDIDEEKIEMLRERTAPHLSKKEQRAFAASEMKLESNESVLADADAYIICVPTPVDDAHEPDLRPLISASKSVARHLKPGALVVVESTVNPGACETAVLPILESVSGLSVEKDFFFAHCPERINPGDAIWETNSIPRVLGGAGPESVAHARALYQKIIDGEIAIMGSLKEAEAVKMVENSFRDINIAFVNELAMSFSRAGIDLTNVLRGAATKPFAFMPHTPGCGVGGHCIPVDPYYLIRYGRENGFEHRFLAVARDINNHMPLYTVDVLEATLETEGKLLAGTTVALLGLAYKKEVPDLRESPALVIRDELTSRGALVQTFDPYVPEESTSANTLQALSGAEAVILATDHELFRTLPPELFLSNNVPVVIDGRNCLPKEAFLSAGVIYRGIGR